jgi:hypothetical protein
MIRRSTTLSTLLGAAMAATLLAGCGTAKTPSPSIQAAPPSPRPSLSASASASAKAESSTFAGAPSSSLPSATAAPTVSLAHVSPALEDQLPSTIESVAMVKFSLNLSAFMASPPPGGDKALYAAWLVKFGKIPSDVNIAISFLPSDSVDFNARAIGVPGASADNLTSTFADVARNAGWTVKSYPNLMATGKNVLEIVDPAAAASGGVGAGYVYARSGVMYEIITTDQALLQDALIQMP